MGKSFLRVDAYRAAWSNAFRRQDRLLRRLKALLQAAQIIVPMSLLRLSLREGRVEEPAGGREPHLLLDELGRLGRAVFTLHARVLPLDGKRPGVADCVEGAGDAVEIDLAAA